MATLDVTGVKVVGFPVDTTITPPTGNNYIAPANTWFGVPVDSTSMTVTPAGDAMCMTVGYLQPGYAQLIQVMTVDEVRTSS